MKVWLVNPNLVAQKSDLFTTGIVYMPIGLASVAGLLREREYDVSVLDTYGEQPEVPREKDGYCFFGLTSNEVCERIGSREAVVVIYAINTLAYRSIMEMVEAIKKQCVNVRIVIIENTQAVTAFSLEHVKEQLFCSGVDYIVVGESEYKVLDLLESFARGDSCANLSGVGCRDGEAITRNPAAEVISELDLLPFPAWDMFPVDNYWRLGYGHGPVQSKKYLPILTSRGCPNECAFCVVASTNMRKWRARSAKNVVSEMMHFYKTMGVREYHFEDVNPTVSEARIVELCDAIQSEEVSFVWKLVSGTKIETICNEETIMRMGQAGCRYISISPETASPALLEAVHKRFDVEHAKVMVAQMKRVGIYSQACFVLGLPGESDGDRSASVKLMKSLVRCGVDEIAVFIISPLPGSELYGKQESVVADLSALNFSPVWRPDYSALNKARLLMYRKFLIYKCLVRPVDVIKQGLRFIRKKFYTKMEMAPFRVLKMKKTLLWNRRSYEG